MEFVEEYYFQEAVNNGPKYIKKCNLFEELDEKKQNPWSPYKLYDLIFAEQLKPFINVLKKTGGVIAGGAVRFLLKGLNRPDDIDIWSFDELQFNEIHNELLILGMELIHSSDRTNIYVFRDFKHTHSKLPCLVQLIKPVTGVNTPEQLMDTFDIIICKAFLDANGDIFVHRLFDEMHHTMVLHVEHVRMPLSSIKRIVKYCSRGWSISTEELVKVMDAWGSLTAEQKEEAIKRTGSQLYNLIPV